MRSARAPDSFRGAERTFWAYPAAVCWCSPRSIGRLRMRPNELRAALAASRPTVGTHLHSTWPSVVEAVGHTGMLDYAEFVAECAPFDLFSLENLCRAAELFDMPAIIKADQEPRRFLAQRAIGAGFQGVLFADVRSVDDARECVCAVRPDQ